MSFVDDLDGRRGFKFRPPAGWERTDVDPDGVRFFDHERGVSWTVGTFDLGLRLHADEDALLAKDTERHTREFFERCYGMVPRGEGLLASRGPRTADPNWSPLVELGRTELAGAPAFRVVHRLFYQPGRETIMGHFLVPLRRGLLELRVAGNDTTTGIRESTLMALEWFVDEAGWWVTVVLGTTTVVPEAELFERAEAVVRSYRVLDRNPPPPAAPSPKSKEWWRFW